jgi:hypothetical protein
VTLATQRRLTFLLLLGVVGTVFLWLGWFAWRSPTSRFLPPSGAAEWIDYPVPPQTTIVTDRCPQEANFHRSFDLAGTPWLGNQLGRRKLSLPWAGSTVQPIQIGLWAAVLLWIILFVHNATCVPLFATGFDATAHLDYIGYIQQHRSLPLADAGWEITSRRSFTCWERDCFGCSGCRRAIRGR